ncbi:hypothetical protein EV673_2868 [Limnobacter thiooxidans]|uniref:Uncharacterized protein n=1 Tax=Limnobacter thiooxidans TaxID=131080 RepID=A0AA86J654_9BURK|nr:hypothetical protein [Limnobacter sp.]MCZ8016633.1 hypothetical protein [Limnobacter sp.]RZS38486.1 hypothetical protein EV673_2868 [Limnobacter thiooxidans]BET25065.1 hypothetical protein RGQ30_05660 [Limnobacter thiooxidans]
MGGSIQSSGSQASSTQSDSIESKIAAYQATGHTRILPDKLPPGITEKDAITNVVGEIATTLRDVLNGHIKKHGVSSKDDRDFFNDVVSNVKAVLNDPANSSILEGIELPRIDQLINLAGSISQGNIKSIPKIKIDLTAAFDSTLIQERQVLKTALSKSSPHSSAEENSNTKAHGSRKPQPRPVQRGPGDTVIDDKKFPLVTEESLGEDVNGPINLSLDGWMAGGNGQQKVRLIDKDPEVQKILDRINSNKITRS